MPDRATCPVCGFARAVRENGTLRRHTTTEDWPGVTVRRLCPGSGLPPLGPWPRPGHGGHKTSGTAPEAGAMSTSDGLGS